MRRKLVDLARIKGAKISYQALSDEFQLQLNMKTKADRLLIADLLKEITVFEHESGRPLLGSLVLTKGKRGKQTDEFYKQCEELGLGSWQDLKANPEFEETLRKSCYEYWGDDMNYKAHRYLNGN